jgi:Glycosyl hydrolase family 52
LLRPTIPMKTLALKSKILALYILLCLAVLFPSMLVYLPVQADKSTNQSSPAPTTLLQLDPRLPAQTVQENNQATNNNTVFGSRFTFDIQPGKNQVYSGTEGTFHDSPASYVVGVMPQGQTGAQMFHMGTLNTQLADSYLRQESWQQGLDTSRWTGKTQPGAGLDITTDIINAFQGEPGCTALADCTSAMQADIAPVLYVGIRLQNVSTKPQKGIFIFGSNRPLAANGACTQFTTAGGESAISLAYAPNADNSHGTLFLGGDRQHWSCQRQQADRAGLTWSYNLQPGTNSIAYLLLGGWNANPQMLVNTHLPANCQSEPLYYTKFWQTKEQVIGYALDNQQQRQNLLGHAQAMERLLLDNKTLPSDQRWLIGDTLRSYKGSSWLTARGACAGGGYDASVYEGTYGFLSTVDVMHEYGYFEITRVPWFFKAEMSTVFTNATSNQYGLYFQHDQGAEVDRNGNCTDPGKGTPTIRDSCYAPPYVVSGMPMPTEENNNVALLMAYYAYVTNDVPFVQQHIQQLQEAMEHNSMVGDPNTGIATEGQDTATTFDAANDCLRNTDSQAGNLYYQGLKEAAAYIATDYLTGLLPSQQQRLLTNWQPAATKIEQAMIDEYNQRGYIPIADNTAYSNCDGRTIIQGDGLFYLQLSGLDQQMNPQLLRDLAQQYPDDVEASIFQGPKAPANVVENPPLYLLASKRAEGSMEQCADSHCLRYTWFSKVMLSSIVADLVYSKYGCSSCKRLNMDEAAYAYNSNLQNTFSDGAREYVGYWDGYFYPRGLISWFYLNKGY